MTQPNCRTATLEEIELMLDWAADEGWNPGLADAQAFQAADPEGFFVAEVDGKTVAAISVVNHSPQMAFLGLYLCLAEYRGRGIGYALWTRALTHAGARTVGLDGVPAQEANYAKSGFVLAGRTRRFEGTLDRCDTAASLAGAADLDAITRLDRAANGYDRPAFLAEWTTQSDSRKTVLLRGPQGITGFATARLCRDGCKIGPIVAPTVDEALTLARQAASALECTDVIIDTPDIPGGLGQNLQGMGFEESFATARMYRGPAPSPGPTLQAIATMELG
ncbi:GNAT family N-acetyltransferase [Mameliella alba]|uniref:Acetyltransferase n=1 Tax=Mameliella alba TaxID=561184 RepID=A0A0B3SLD1_9RHOB|nr:GNAT family N-acetyltransferase [Mameliella alba]KHQ51344.1 Acetyltransferase [Mameliella alba]